MTSFITLKPYFLDKKKWSLLSNNTEEYNNYLRPKLSISQKKYLIIFFLLI